MIWLIKQREVKRIYIFTIIKKKKSRCLPFECIKVEQLKYQRRNLHQYIHSNATDLLFHLPIYCLIGTLYNLQGTNYYSLEHQRNMYSQNQLPNPGCFFWMNELTKDMKSDLKFSDRRVCEVKPNCCFPASLVFVFRISGSLIEQ